jgi:predicted MFS family arabinose efflux permease
VTVYGLLFATSALLLGSLAEALGARRMIVGALVLFGAATVCVGLAPTFAMMLLFRALSGLAASVVQTANWIVLSGAIPYERRGQATGWVMQAGTLALLAGVPLGGLLADAVSWHVIFFVVGGVALLIAVILFSQLPPDPMRSTGSIPDLLRHTSSELWLLAAHGRARRTLAISMLIWVAMHGFYTYMGAFLGGRFSLDAAQVAQLTLVLGIGYAIGGQMGGRLSDRFGREPVIIGGMAIMMVAFIGLPLTTAQGIAALLIVLLGFGYFFGYAAQVTAMTELLPGSRGIAMAANYFVTYVGAAVGAWLGGLVLPGGFHRVGWLSSGAALLAIVIVSGQLAQARRQAAAHR